MGRPKKILFGDAMAAAADEASPRQSSHILLLEDDFELGELLRTGLIGFGLTVHWERYGESACRSFGRGVYDALLVDLGIPDMDGTDFVRRIRAIDSTVPIVIVTGRDGIDDRIKALDCGADAYLVKPFDLVEVLAHLRTLRRRIVGTKLPSTSLKGLEGDMLNEKLFSQGGSVPLTSREFLVLQPFIEKDHHLTPKQVQLHLQFLGGSIEASELEKCLGSLRAKLGSDVVAIRDDPPRFSDL